MIRSLLTCRRWGTVTCATVTGARIRPLAARCFAIASSATGKGKAGKLTYVCNSCGQDSIKWAGQCPSCHEWDTMKEFREAAAGSSSARNVSPSTFTASVAQVPSPRTGGAAWVTKSDGVAGIGRLVSLTNVVVPRHPRVMLQSKELDRLFGGGLVRGSVVLVAGSPGVGKSTILLQIAALMSHATKGGRPYAECFRKRQSTANGGGSHLSHAAAPDQPASLVAYVSGEESTTQIKSRATRLGLDAPNLLLMNETRVEDILSELEHARATLASASSVGSSAGSPDAGLAAIIIDSIQTMFTDAVPSAAGTVTQVRECAVRYLQYAKATNTPIFLVGHVTKSGDIAGPRVLEHLVDTVVYVEADEGMVSGNSVPGASTTSPGGTSSSSLRLMRTTKNRFGSTSEVGIFEMTDDGLVESDAATAFLSNVPHGPGGEAATQSDGVAVTSTIEGTRAFCVEVQALATHSPLPYPRHRSSGIQMDRIYLLLAVLSRHAAIRSHSYDIFVNVVGGLRIVDPCTDLAVALAIASSIVGRPMPSRTLALGEVGLGGELRPGSRMSQRLATAKQLGFKQAIVPAHMDADVARDCGLQLLRASTVSEAIQLAYGRDVGTLLRKRTQGERPKGQHHSLAGSSSHVPSTALPHMMADEEEDKDQTTGH